MLQSLCAVRHAVACAPCSKLHGTDRASELESLTAVLWGCAHGSSPSMPVKGFHINMNTSLNSEAASTVHAEGETVASAGASGRALIGHHNIP